MFVSSPFGLGRFLPPASAAQGSSAGFSKLSAHTWHIWGRDAASDDARMKQLIQQQDSLTTNGKHKESCGKIVVVGTQTSERDLPSFSVYFPCCHTTGLKLVETKGLKMAP